MNLASPAITDKSANDKKPYIVYNDGSIYCYGTEVEGFRPVVCLKSNIKLKQQSEGNYIIE